MKLADIIWFLPGNLLGLVRCNHPLDALDVVGNTRMEQALGAEFALTPMRCVRCGKRFDLEYMRGILPIGSHNIVFEQNQPYEKAAWKADTQR